MKKATMLTMLLMSTNFLVFAQFSGGTGVQADPYQITTLNDLETLSLNSVHWDKYFVQTADIDASATSTWNAGAGFLPIGNNNNPFVGFYDGQGHIIDAMFINRNIPQVALFGHIWTTSTVNNLGVININFTGLGASAGLVGLHRGTITNCFSTGELHCTDYSGGLAGSQSGGSILNCYSSVNVTGTQRVGGLVGFNNGGSVSNSYSRGTVLGTLYQGGLIGYEIGSITTNSFWDQDNSGQLVSAGGTPKSSVEMKDINTYLSDQWDFNTPIWQMNCVTNDGYPILFWQELNTAPDITGTTSVTDVTCEWNQDGAIDLTPSGGTAPYSFAWSNGDVSEDISNISQGSYTVTITDDNLCNASITVDVESDVIMNTATSLSGITISAVASGLSYQWINCSDNSEINGAINQSYTPSTNGDYAVIVDNGTCADTSACVSITTVGIDELGNVELAEMYPNPANDKFTVQLSKWEDAIITIYNTLGKIVYQEAVKSKKTSIDSSTYPKGVYLVSIQNKEAKQTKRIVID